MADTKLTALTATTTPASTDVIYVVVDPGTTPVSKKVTLANTANAIDAATWAVIQASQLTNEIKGWPPVVQPDADLVTLNLWWDDVATPTTKATVVDVAGEAGITETFELALKCVGDGAGDGLQQTWTYADEPRLKSGRVMSALLAIWSVSSVAVTAKLVNSDTTHTDASAVTAAAWTIVKVENHTLAGTSCSLQVTVGGAGTFYVVPLGANIGAKAFPLRPRGLRYVDKATAAVLNGVDPGGADWADLDLTTQTGNLAVTAYINVQYFCSTALHSNIIYIRRKGDTSAGLSNEIVRNVEMVGYYQVGTKIVPMDDGQVVQWKSSGVAGDTESLYLNVVGWWEWE